MFNRNIVLIIFLAVIFGLAGGVVGEIVSRVYLFESTFNIPVFRDIDLSGENGSSSFVISEARRVIVEQDQKVIDTINMVDDSIVGIYQMKEGSKLETKEAFDLNNYYFINNQLGQGFVITSDGWIITEFLPEKYAQVIFSDNNKKLIKEDLIKNFVIIDKEKDVYSIEDVVIDEDYSFVFLKVNANDLPVRKFAQEEDIVVGQVALAVNWQNKNLFSTISEIKTDNALVKSSDIYLNKIVLANEINEDLYSSYLFNLSGDLVGLINKNGEIFNINIFSSAVRGMLETKEIKRAKLGVNYVDFSELINLKESKERKGAVIYKNNSGISIIKNSVSEVSGLKEGDIILSINNTELDSKNSLNKIINKYLEGDMIRVAYERDGEIKEVDIKFNSLKKE